MTDRINTRRTDAQLECMLYETAHWTVNGSRGVILCDVASLFCAVEQAVKYAAWGRHIQALVRADGPDVVVFSGQLRRLVDRLDPDDYPFALYAFVRGVSRKQLKYGTFPK